MKRYDFTSDRLCSSASICVSDELLARGGRGGGGLRRRWRRRRTAVVVEAVDMGVAAIAAVVVAQILAGRHHDVAAHRVGNRSKSPAVVDHRSESSPLLAAPAAVAFDRAVESLLAQHGSGTVAVTLRQCRRVASAWRNRPGGAPVEERSTELPGFARQRRDGAAEHGRARSAAPAICWPAVRRGNSCTRHPTPFPAARRGDRDLAIRQ